MQAAIDDRALSRLRWRCRRGLLENDLLDLLLRRKEPEGDLDRSDLRAVLEMLRP